MAESKVIEIKTLEAVRNVKDLKDNISALKAKIDDVNTSTEEYADLTKELSRNQAALRNVMNGTNSTFDKSIQAAQGLDNSYNSLVQQLKEATQEWRAVPKYLSDADKAAGNINQAWTESARRVEELRSQLKDMDATTGSYVRNVGNYKSALEGFSGAMGQVKQVGGDMVNGISAMASSLAIMGYNTDGLTESMKNLRIVVAAMQGAKGFAGLLIQLKNYFKIGKDAVKTTKEQTVATQQLTTATKAEAVATTEAATATNVLKTALISTGIGALVVALGMLVAHFEEVVQWIGKLGEKLGLWKKDIDSVKEANEKLNEKFDEQNRQLTNQQKLLSAQGTSNKNLLIQKRELINAQIAETKATIESVKARIKQIEADARWWKFWQGTKGKLKEANAELEELEETLKNLQNAAEDINIDIQVETIKDAQAAAAQAQKDAENALAAAQKLVGSGIEAATEALKGLKTEEELITDEYNEHVKLINSAITATSKLTGVTKEQKELLQKGLNAETTLYTKRLADYYGKKYEEKAAKKIEEITNAYGLEYKELEKVDNIRRGMFDLGDAFNFVVPIRLATAEQRKQYDILKATLDMINEDIPDAVRELSEAEFSALEFTSMEELQKKFGQPAATAIKIYFSKSKELEEAGTEIVRTMIEGYESAINEAMSNGQFATAGKLVSELGENLREELGIDLTKLESILSPVGTAYIDYMKNLYDEIKEKRDSGAIPSLLEPFFGLDSVMTNELRQLREYMEMYEEGSLEWVALNEQAAQLSAAIWDKYFGTLEKHFDVYERAIANLMDGVADAWEAALQAQVKNGKKSEEEAKRSFENVKKLQMAAAIINTAGAVVQALADPTIPSFIVKGINAAAALAAGTAQVLKISMTEFNSTAAASTSSAPSMVDRTPQLQYTVGLNSADYAEAAAATPIKAFVVDKDLSEGLQNYNSRQRETTF